MNFLYGGGGISRSAHGDSFQPLQLSRSRVKLQPRRLRSGGGQQSLDAGDGDRPDRPVRTHIFMDLVQVGGGSGRDREPPARRTSPGLIEKLLPRKESWKKQQSREEAAAAAAAAAAPAPAAAAGGNSANHPDRMAAGRRTANGAVAEELRSLDQLDQDCFIVPYDMVERFLPIGHKLPPTPSAPGQRLNLRETDSPGIGVVMHVLGHLVPLSRPSALNPSPPRHVQLGACATLLREAAHQAAARDAMLLSNMERTECFPFLLYYTVEKQRRSARDCLATIVHRMRDIFSRLETSYVAEHTIRLYDEVASIARPPLSDQRRPVSDQTGYIVSIFRVLEGEDRVSFERDWLSWTGARLLYRSIPACAGLRRMVLHKSCTGGDIFYILTCECSALLDNVVASARALPALRARLVGYTGMYKPMVVL